MEPQKYYSKPWFGSDHWSKYLEDNVEIIKNEFFESNLESTEHPGNKMLAENANVRINVPPLPVMKDEISVAGETEGVQAAKAKIMELFKDIVSAISFYPFSLFSNRDTILLLGQIRPSRFRSPVTVVRLVLPSKGEQNLYIICKAGSNLAIIMV